MFRIANMDLIYLYLLIPVLVVVAIYMSYRIKKLVSKFADESTFNRLNENTSEYKKRWKLILMLFALACLITAAIRPQLGSGLEEVKRKGVDVIVALDVSNSMNAKDISPTRLERSTQAIYRLIDKLQGDRIGIVVFAGQAFIQLPITTDYGAAKLFLSNISTGMVPVQGTAIGAAIEKCMDAVGDSSTKSAAVVVITDGENHEDDAVQAAKEAVSRGMVVHTIGMGSPQGAPVPDGKGNFISDGSGATVISKLDDITLQQIADAGKGKYIRATSGDDGMGIILKELDGMEKKEFSSKMFTIYDEQFGWFLGLALIVLLIEPFISNRKNKWWSKLNLFGENSNKINEK
ncbi:MAG: VWA domain-containing protein [Arcticibacter sp.]